MSGFDISKYRAMFLEESVELFENTDTLLLQAEENGTLKDEDMNSLFRYVHTLKGSSASVELSRFAKFTHEIESFMDKLRNKQLTYQPEMATLLIDCVDTMKTVLDQEVNDTLTEDSFEELTKEYINAIKEISEDGVVKTVVAPATTKIAIKEQTNDDEAFGFFDDSITTQASPAIASIDEAFGFFDDEFTTDTKIEPARSVTVDDEAFGFFDDEFTKSQTSYQNEREIKTDDDEGFGFFDDTYTSLAKPVQDFGTYPVNSDDEGFGFFDDDLIASLARSTKPTKPSAPPEPITVSAPIPAKQTPTVVQSNKPSAQTEEKAKPADSGDVKGANSIRVDLSKIDILMNNVGELVIVNSMLFQLTDEISDAGTRAKVAEKLKLLDRHTRELQDSVMAVRMVPMENIYSKFPKTVRDISKKLGKKVEFKHIGDNVEIDKAMIEGLTDPLMHIVRNSLDHGLEMPDVRTAKGKPESGTILISAEQANGQILISITDDGGGIPADKVASKAVERGVITQSQFDQMTHDEKVMMIFAPGLSTAEAVTDLSGRGVGMDVVKTNISKLGGTISVNTELGIGTTMTIALPLTLAILDGLNIRIAEKHYILPLASIVESLQPKEDMIKRIGDGEEELLMLRQEFIPVVRLHRLFGIEPDHANLHQGMLIVVRAGTQKLALFVDEFLHQQQVVVKPIDKNFRNVKGIGGATVRGDGSIGLIIDVIGILEEQKKLERRRLR